MFIMMILLTKDALASGLMTLMTTNQDPSTFTPLSHLLLDNLDLEGLEQVLHLVISLFWGEIIIIVFFVIIIRKETLVGQEKV